MVTNINGLNTLYAQPIERIAKKQLDAAGRDLFCLPFLVFVFSSNKVLTVPRRVIIQAL